MDENQTNPPASLSGYELLQWAKTAYGEVTSFTDLENPQQIHFQVGKGEFLQECCFLPSAVILRQTVELLLAPPPSPATRSWCHQPWALRTAVQGRKGLLRKDHTPFTHTAPTPTEHSKPSEEWCTPPSLERKDMFSRPQAFGQAFLKL